MKSWFKVEKIKDFLDLQSYFYIRINSGQIQSKISLFWLFLSIFVYLAPISNLVTLYGFVVKFYVKLTSFSSPYIKLDCTGKSLVLKQILNKQHIFCLKSHNFLTLRKFSLFSALGIFSELRIFSKKFLKFSILLLASWIFLNTERFLGGQASQRFMLSYCQKQKARSNHWINQSRIDFLCGNRVSVLPVKNFSNSWRKMASGF